jgi:hypothetical protein
MREPQDQPDDQRHLFTSDLRPDAEVHRLRDELTALKATLADREMALAKAALEAEQARARWDQESQAALLKAEQAWKAHEVARLAEAEAKWRKQSAAALGEATARCEAAEAVLAQLKKEAAHGSRAEFERRAEPIDEEPRPSRGSLIRDVLIVAALVAVAITAYPSIAPFLPQSWQSSIDSFTGGPGPVADDSGTSAASPPPASSEVAARRSVVVFRDVNVRAGPSATAKVVSTLPRGSRVTLIERRGSWALVQIEGDNGNARSLEGWVSGSFLK